MIFSPEVEKAKQQRLKGCWATPPKFREAVVQRYKLNFDAAANKDDTLFPNFLSEEQNALTRMWCGMNSWQSRVWLNPPHRNLFPWFEKAWEQIHHPSGRIDIIVIMTLPSFSAKWWRRYAEKADEIVDLSPRVQFIPPEGLETGNSGNSRERCLVVFRREPRHPLSPARYTWHWQGEED